MKKTGKKMNDKRAAKASALAFRRETIRNLTETESKHVVGGRICTSESCLGRTCPNTVCTITVDTTL